MSLKRSNMIRCVGWAANECRRKLASKETIFSTVDLPEALAPKIAMVFGTRCSAPGHTGAKRPGCGTFPATRRSMTWGSRIEQKFSTSTRYSTANSRVV